ncbi:MAG TPA: sialidase family protein [Planctomicrobium sp.]|nr:sialidase family protein [Planctomicrobium sp.]
MILAAEEFQQRKEMAYISFPAVVPVNESTLLISYKRGRSHASDPGAPLEVIRFNTTSNQVEWRGIIGQDSKRIYQMGEWIRFPNGRLGNFVDVQHVVTGKNPKKNQRTGLEWTFTDDNGQSFSPMKKLGLVDGVEYGYVFEGATQGDTVYVLAMDFPELPPVEDLLDKRGKRVFGNVSVIATSDNGTTWRFIKNLNQEFGGIKINESSLIPLKEGFLVATRGYDSQIRLHQVDKDFNVLQERNLTSDYPFIESHVGRPRLYSRDDHVYLIGRNHRNKSMELANFRLNLESLSIERMVVLDPDQQTQPVIDGYYAVPYFQESAGKTRFNVITYRRFKDATNPDLIRLEFDWDEVK